MKESSKMAMFDVIQTAYGLTEICQHQSLSSNCGGSAHLAHNCMDGFTLTLIARTYGLMRSGKVEDRLTPGTDAKGDRSFSLIVRYNIYTAKLMHA